MRYFCVVLALVAMPLSAGAQQHQRPAPPPPMTGLGPIGLPGTWVGLPPTINYPKPWEWTVPAPAWERYQAPAWERQRPPAWEHGPRPSQPIQHGSRFGAPYQGLAVVYVMQPYPVYEPYHVVVVAPAPQPAEVERAETPAAPIVVPSGSRTIYVIPGCYLGNVPPDKDRLPAGCDISRMKTHAPQ